jgi:hypothetical protein
MRSCDFKGRRPGFSRPSYSGRDARRWAAAPPSSGSTTSRPTARIRSATPTSGRRTTRSPCIAISGFQRDRGVFAFPEASVLPALAAGRTRAARMERGVRIRRGAVHARDRVGADAGPAVRRSRPADPRARHRAGDAAPRAGRSTGPGSLRELPHWSGIAVVRRVPKAALGSRPRQACRRATAYLCMAA